MKYRNKSIFYVNYSPYENAGYILDYLRDNFEYVYLFSVGFHDLGEKRSKNILKIYKKRKPIEIKSYFHIRISRKLEFLFVPVRSILNLIQIFSVARYIFKKYGKVDKYLSVNAFTAWAGLILRGRGFVSRTIFWVWDYYPLNHKNYLVLLMRWIYWHFDRIAMFSDRVVFLNSRLAKIHKKSKIFSRKLKYSIVPIGTKPVLNKRKRKVKDDISLVFLGVLKQSQGLDFILDVYPEIVKKFSSVNLNIIGGGPDKDYFVNKAARIDKKIKFFGNISDQEVDKIISKSTVGLATYVPDKSNVSYYGDPSKVKRYISFGLPVITTDVFEFSKEIANNHTGVVVKYGDIQGLVKSLKEVISKYDYFSRNSYKLSGAFEYNTIYKEMIKI